MVKEKQQVWAQTPSARNRVSREGWCKGRGKLREPKGKGTRGKPKELLELAKQPCGPLVAE